MRNDPDRNLPLVFAAAVLAILSGTLVISLQASIAVNLRSGYSNGSWIMGGYLLAMGLLLPFAGGLGDRFDREKIVGLGVGLIAVGSLICIASAGLDVLLLGRACQGAGAAAVLPNAVASLSARRRHGKLVPLYASLCTGVTALGPVVGGVIASSLGWRAIFLPVFVIAVVVAIGLAIGPARPPSLPIRRERPGGFADVGATLLLTLYTAAIYGGFFDLLLTVPADLIRSGGYAPVGAGAAMLPATVVVIFAGPALIRLFAAGASTTALTSAACLALLATILLPRLPGAGAYLTTMLAPVLLIGLAMTFAAAPLTAAVIDAAGPERAGVAAGINSAAARLGGAVTVTLHGHMDGHAPAFVSKLPWHWLDATLLLSAAAVSLLLAVRATPRPAPARSKQQRTTS